MYTYIYIYIYMKANPQRKRTRSKEQDQKNELAESRQISSMNIHSQDWVHGGSGFHGTDMAPSFRSA